MTVYKAGVMVVDGRILERDEIDRLGREALDGDDDALAKLVETHMRLFYKHAAAYSEVMEANEVVAIMVENVVEKFPHKFNPDRGNFTKFAKVYAKSGILWYLRFRRRVVHFPRRRKDLQEDFDNDPDGGVYTDCDCGDERTFNEFVDDDHRRRLREKIRESLQDLEPIDRELVRLRFGLRDNPDDPPGRMLYYKEIGDIMERSNEWARKRLIEALNKLQPRLAEFDD